MEKLIQLLNEHELEEAKEIGIIVYKWEAHGGILFAIPTRPMNISALSILETRAVLVNKEYGFIKRLVEKNKIEIERLHKIVDYRLEIKENYVNAHNYNSDCLIMLLAISDTPIDDLISYLK